MKTSLLLTVLTLITTGCSRLETPVGATAAQAPAVPVNVETVTASEIAGTYRASGTVRARYTATIAAKIAANIVEIYVHTGDRVQAGQTLIILDRRDLEAQLRRSEGARAEVESSVAETENAIAAARTHLELARVTHRRFEDLLAKMSVSQQEFDESRARLGSAEAALEIAASRRRQADARRSQVEAEVSAARVALDHATLRAPFAGLITERRADPGSLTTPGAPLLTVEREGNLRLEASIDESRLGLVRVGESLAVEIEGLNRTVRGRVAEIVPSVDSATRSVAVKIELPFVPGLRAGMFARALFDTDKRAAVLVPQSAIVQRGQIRSVYVVEAGAARLRFVTLGEQRDDLCEVLSGLKPGEKVVVPPPALLADGGRVAIPEATK